MADEAYRAVFLRVHPTGKMVLSLTTEADGKESEYAALVAEELGVPALDVKVLPADENRFGSGHGFKRARRPARPPRSRARRARSWPRRSCSRPSTSARKRWTGTTARSRRAARRARSPTSRCTPTAPARSRPASRAGWTPRRSTRLMDYGPHNATLTVHTTRAGAAAKAGHDLTILVERWNATLDRRRARLRGRLVLAEGHRGPRRHLGARRRRQGRDQADDRRGDPQGHADHATATASSP